MHYPFIVYRSRTKLFLIFPDLVGEPYIADMSPNSRLLHGLDARDQRAFQAVLEKEMGTALLRGRRVWERIHQAHPRH